MLFVDAHDSMVNSKPVIIYDGTVDKIKHIYKLDSVRYADFESGKKCELYLIKHPTKKVKMITDTELNSIVQDILSECKAGIPFWVAVNTIGYQNKLTPKDLRVVRVEAKELWRMSQC